MGWHIRRRIHTQEHRGRSLVVVPRQGGLWAAPPDRLAPPAGFSWPGGRWSSSGSARCRDRRSRSVKRARRRNLRCTAAAGDGGKHWTIRRHQHLRKRSSRPRGVASASGLAVSVDVVSQRLGSLRPEVNDGPQTIERPTDDDPPLDCERLPGWGNAGLFLQDRRNRSSESTPCHGIQAR